MSTRYDVLEAKANYVDHIGEHKCAKVDPTDPEFKYPRCPDRLLLWQTWIFTAERWGRNWDDNDRQRKQFFERNPAALQSAHRS